ncbi:MAG: hypothetical protein QUS14_13275 [Pyrinomonadaceae bacterium]|nr:hypothetical protein [Pyrinomonadaceae bacterium]
MKKNLMLLTFAFSLFVLAGTAHGQSSPPAESGPPAKTESKSANIDGKWTFTVDAGGQLIDLAVEIKQTGEDFTGSMASAVGNGSLDKGKVSADKMSATLNADVQGSPTVIGVAGKIEGEKITGTMDVPGIGVVSFTAARPK